MTDDVDQVLLRFKVLMKTRCAEMLMYSRGWLAKDHPWMKPARVADYEAVPE